MTDYNYSTPFTSGATGIPIKTIQEYVSTFRKHFSDQAAQPKKGRRFLPADVEKLHLIRRLRAERVPDPDIEKYLSGEIEPPFKMAHQFTTDEVMQMAAHSLEYYQAAQKILEAAGEQLHDAKALHRAAQEIITQARNEMTATRRQINTVNETLLKFRQWQNFMMRLDDSFNPYKPDDPNEPMPEIKQEKRKGLFGLGG